MHSRRTMLLIVLPTLVAALTPLVYLQFLQPFFPRYGKASVGTVGQNSYVITSGNANELLCDGTSWKGGLRTQTETVVCQNSQVQLIDFDSIRKRPLIIHFTPERIQIIDLATLKGGHYLRRVENSLPNNSE